MNALITKFFKLPTPYSTTSLSELTLNILEGHRQLVIYLNNVYLFTSSISPISKKVTGWQTVIQQLKIVAVMLDGSLKLFIFHSNDNYLSLIKTGMEVPVSTTRPETMFGDVAVAIHPNDSRYLVRLFCPRPPFRVKGNFDLF